MGRSPKLRLLMVGLVCAGFPGAAFAQAPAFTEQDAMEEARVALPDATWAEMNIAFMVAIATNICDFTISSNGEAALKMTGTNWGRVEILIDNYVDGGILYGLRDLEEAPRNRVCAETMMQMNGIIDPAPFPGFE
jgi:hypothetical protein